MLCEQSPKQTFYAIRQPS